MIDNNNLKLIFKQLNSWCETNSQVVKSVYDDCNGLSLQDLVYYLFGVVKEYSGKVIETGDKYNELYNYVQEYFSNLNVQNEINAKIDSLVEDGTIEKLLNRTLAKLRNKNIILIGDSYGLRTDFWSGWIEELDNLNLFQIHASAVGGSGFIGDLNVNNFQQQLESISVDKEIITDIIIIGGYNDMSTDRSYSDLYNAINNINKYITSNFNSATLHIGFCAVHYNNSLIMRKIYNYNYYYRQICSNLGIKFIDRLNFIVTNKDYVFINSGNPNSNFHLNTEGSKTLALYLSKYIVNGNIGYGVDAEVFNNINVYKYFDGKICLFPNILNAIGTFVLDIKNVPFNQWIEASDFSNSKLLWGADLSVSFKSVSDLYDINGKNLGILAWTISDNKLMVKNLTAPSGINSDVGIMLAIPSTVIPYESLY